MLTTLPAPVSGDSKKVPLHLDIADTALELCRTYNQRYSICAFTIISGRLLALKDDLRCAVKGHQSLNYKGCCCCYSSSSPSFVFDLLLNMHITVTPWKDRICLCSTNSTIQQYLESTEGHFSTPFAILTSLVGYSSQT